MQGHCTAAAHPWVKCPPGQLRALLLALPVTVKVTTGSLPGVFTSQISHEVERFSLGGRGRSKRRSKQNKKTLSSNKPGKCF